MIYDWTLQSLRDSHERIIATPLMSSVPAEVVVALVDIATAAQCVVEADRSAWQQSELDNAVIRLREMFGGKL